MRTVLVTGASRGIGLAVFKHFLAAGHYVIGTAVSEGGVKAISDAVAAGQGQSMQLDLGSVESIQAFATALKEQGQQVDIIVNNAGITQDTLSLSMKAEQWDRVIDTNLSGTFKLIQALLRPMLKKRFGRIINLSSVVGSTGNPGQCNYSASKAGLEGMTRSLAHELSKRGITVNAIAPGFISTDMTDELNDEQRAAMLEKIPAGRMGRVEDIAHSVAFLASDEAEYITGQTLHVNGGMYMQ